jgi:hypothetical protein
VVESDAVEVDAARRLSDWVNAVGQDGHLCAKVLEGRSGAVGA